MATCQHPCRSTCLLFSRTMSPTSKLTGNMSSWLYGTLLDKRYVFRLVPPTLGVSLWWCRGLTYYLQDYDRLRPLSYPDSHVILICFAVDSPDSLDNVQEKVRFHYSEMSIYSIRAVGAQVVIECPPMTCLLSKMLYLLYRPHSVIIFPNADFVLCFQWISEVMHFCAGLPIILVGCKKDLRRDGRVIEELRKTSQRPVTPEEVNLLPASFVILFIRTLHSHREWQSPKRLVPGIISNVPPRPVRACEKCFSMRRVRRC